MANSIEKETGHRLTKSDARKGGKVSLATPENIVKRALRQLYTDLLSKSDNTRLKAIQVALNSLYNDAKPKQNKRDISDRLLDKIATLGIGTQSDTHTISSVSESRQGEEIDNNSFDNSNNYNNKVVNTSPSDPGADRDPSTRARGGS